MGLVALWHVDSSQTREQNHVPCVGRWILNHWTTREVPGCNFKLVFLRRWPLSKEVAILGKLVPSGGHGQCKGPEVGP